MPCSAQGPASTECRWGAEALQAAAPLCSDDCRIRSQRLLARLFLSTFAGASLPLTHSGNAV